MSDRRREFVAEDLWFLIGVVTVPLAGLASLAGSGLGAGIIGTIGWFLLAPLFLFWGEDIATVLYGPPEEEPPASADPVEERKREYARGNIDEAEFERRLDVLMDVDLALKESEIAANTRQVTEDRS